MAAGGGAGRAARRAVLWVQVAARESALLVGHVNHAGLLMEAAAGSWGSQGAEARECVAVPRRVLAVLANHVNHARLLMHGAARSDGAVRRAVKRQGTPPIRATTSPREAAASFFGRAARTACHVIGSSGESSGGSRRRRPLGWSGSREGGPLQWPRLRDRSTAAINIRVLLGAAAILFGFTIFGILHKQAIQMA